MMKFRRFAMRWVRNISKLLDGYGTNDTDIPLSVTLLELTIKYASAAVEVFELAALRPEALAAAYRLKRPPTRR